MRLKYILPILFITLFTVACSSDGDDDIRVINEVENLIKIKELTNDNHTIELYNESGTFYTGYNKITLRIKNNADDSYLENADISWMPMMQMPTMQHSCPRSVITKVANKNTLFEGYIIYQMTNSDGTGWSLTVNYTLDNEDYTVTDTITVMQNDDQNVTSVMGEDGVRYVLALINPTEPIIGINDLTVGLYKMENMMSFPIVEDYSIMLDPRMPGMGNHSSPNNTDLSYNGLDNMYHGDLSLTMTGYWVLNLKLVDDNNTVLKGEDITEENTQSSLYLELEF